MTLTKSGNSFMFCNRVFSIDRDPGLFRFAVIDHRYMISFELRDLSKVLPFCKTMTLLVSTSFYSPSCIWRTSNTFVVGFRKNSHCISVFRTWSCDMGNTICFPLNSLLQSDLDLRKYQNYFDYCLFMAFQPGFSPRTIITFWK